MAGNHNRNGIRTIGQTHSPARLRIADPFGKLSVGGGVAVRDFEQLSPDLLLKGRAFWREWEIESFKLTGKIGAELADSFAEGHGIFLPLGFRHSRASVFGERNLTKSGILRNGRK